MLPPSLRLSPQKWRSIPSPAFVLSEEVTRHNLEALARVKASTGCAILLALKGFACFHLFPLVRQYLDGCAASSVNEARLGREMGGEVHAFAPAYSEDDIKELSGLCDHLIFNSHAQLRRFGPMVREVAPKTRLGIRINPEHSETEIAMYDPCAPGSRLGVRQKHLDRTALQGVTGLHFHTLCEKDAPHLARTLAAVEQKFGDLLPRMEWCNMGGGHLITRDDYDTELLIQEINRIQQRYNLRVILEPGAAVAWETGVLLTTVLDLVPGEPPTAILDCSIAAHMPDVLEMPYRPRVKGAGLPGEKQHTFRLGGVSCLAGDVAGDYSFDQPLMVGARVVFHDMAHYTMVKTTMFNGVRHPAIVILRENGSMDVVRRFRYEDYRSRMG